MAQKLQVVQCVTCQIFQVQIEKKSTNKWTCKVCNTKQSLKQVFHGGTGKECRIVVQKLNEQRLSKETEKANEALEQDSKSDNHFEADIDWNSDFGEEDSENQATLGVTYQTTTAPKSSRWAKYIANEDNDANLFE